MNYDSYVYLFPPRPESKTSAELLPFFENRGQVAQVKKNGTCTVIFTNGTEVIFKTRHATESPAGDDHKAWTPTKEHIKFFKDAGGEKGTWNVFVAELIHSKTQDIKNQFYIFDLIVRNGVQLVGTTVLQRQVLLHSMWKPIADEFDQVRVHQFIGVAKTFHQGFDKIHEKIVKESEVRGNAGLNVIDEGLVLKNPKIKMSACFKNTANQSWSTKCRIYHKNYSF